ncbi:MAG: PLP-dependent aminotransferase family protein [Alphaproteobacteria bacterium]|jgi:GntR family transcriptional regulator/MocR family aminotransferase
MGKQRTILPDWSALMPVRTDPGPRGAALYAALRRMIEDGRVPPGAKLPPSRVLAAQARIARNVVVAAFERLAAEGYVVARVGAGSFVAPDVPRLAPRAPRPLPAPALLPAMPGRLGSAMADPRSFDLLRRLLARDLARPSAAHLHYGDPRGAPALREAIAGYLRSARAVRVHPDQVMVTSGAQQAIDIVVRTVLAPGDAAWIEDPAYPMAAALLRGAGQRIVPVRVDAEGLDVAAGRRAAPRARAAYATPSHQFPLGVAMTMRRRLELLAWAREAGAWIIEDDYDSEFRYAGPPLAALQGIDDAGRVVYVGTFSKSLFPGLRVGYAVLPEAILGKAIALRERTDRQPSTIADGALAAFIAEGHLAAHVRRARKRARAARDALVAGLAQGPLLAQAPDQGLHLVASLPGWLDEARAIEVAAQAGLFARPLSAMHLARRRRTGLVMGFSGFSPEAFAIAAREASARLARLAPRLARR